MSGRAHMRYFLLIILVFPLLCPADESTPEHTVATLWSALSSDAGESADSASLRSLFHESAVIFGGRYKDGASQLKRSSAEEFLKSLERVRDKGFHECEVSRVVHRYDHFAVAYSVVESRTDKTAEAPDFVGVNSIQLYKVGTQWKILSLYYHVEKEGLPVSLGPGVSGKCVL